jgi:hypothetical protein
MENCLTYIELDELKRRKLDCGKLLSMSYTSSGGMSGSYHSRRINFENNTVETITHEWHHAPRIKRIYDVPSDKVEEIKKIVIDNNLCAWSEITVNRELIALDAPTGRTNLTFEELSVSIDDNIYETEEEQEIMRDLFTKFSSLIDEKYLTKEENNVSNPFSMNGFMGMKPPQGSCSFCPECGAKIESDTAKYCPECATKLIGN